MLVQQMEYDFSHRPDKSIFDPARIQGGFGEIIRIKS
jgi:hypothetical protein